MIYPYLADLRHFYKTPLGYQCQYFLGKYVKIFSQKAQQSGIIGYGLPYISTIPEVVFSTLPVQQGIDFNQKNMCLSHLDCLPLKDNCLDFLLVVHCFEFYERPLVFLQEIKRVLKDQGTLVIIVPYFFSYWLRKFSNPFSLGKHYTSFRMQKFFENVGLTVEAVKGTLCFPCFNKGYDSNFLRSWEQFSQKFFPILPNVMIYKVTKQTPGFIFPPIIPLKAFQNY